MGYPQVAWRGRRARERLRHNRRVTAPKSDRQLVAVLGAGDQERPVGGMIGDPDWPVIDTLPGQHLDNGFASWVNLWSEGAAERGMKGRREASAHAPQVRAVSF